MTLLAGALSGFSGSSRTRSSSTASATLVAPARLAQVSPPTSSSRTPGLYPVDRIVAAYPVGLALNVTSMSQALSSGGRLGAVPSAATDQPSALSSGQLSAPGARTTRSSAPATSSAQAGR